MEENRAEWLPHLTPEIVEGIEGNFLDAYVVALEGWRRGLTLKWHVKESGKFNEMRTWFVDEPGQLFSLSSEDRTHYFFRTRGDKVTNEAVDIGRDKEKTKQVLMSKGIAMPEGKEFTKENTNEEVLEYAGKLGYPVVVKPTDGSFGKGVFTNITSAGELEHTLDYMRNDLDYEKIIVEQYIPGKEYRLYVVDHEVVGAMNRIPANVTGDGINSIQALIDIKNKERSLNPRLVSCPIVVNKEVEDYIGRKGYTLDSIPDKEEYVQLIDKTNISIGGDPVDVFDTISDEVKNAAIEALHGIPGLTHGAVDLIVHEETKKPYIIELNPTANLGGLLFPIKGKARDIPKAIIDYYFPETKDDERKQTTTFFDYYDVIEPLKARDAYSTTVTPCPQEELHKKKYIVSGDVLDIGYHRGLRKQAFERYLHGYIMTLEEGDIQIVVGGTDLEMVDDFKNGIWEDEERAQVIEVQVEETDEPIKVGFEIKTDLKTQIEELEMYRQELETIQYEIKKLEVERRKYYNSLSWKVTAPVRLVGAIRKKLQN